ncbi:hypothetical protein [Streptomyces sp. NPDC002644]
MTTAKKTTSSRPTAARKAEAEHTEEEHEIVYASFEYRGTEYQVPSDPLDVPMEIVYADGEAEMIEIILGEEQWEKFMASRPTLRQFRTFSERALEAAGYGGEDKGN